MVLRRWGRSAELRSGLLGDRVIAAVGCFGFDDGPIGFHEVGCPVGQA